MVGSVEIGSNRVRFYTCWYKSDDSTPANIRPTQCHCLRPIAKPEFFQHMIEIPHGRTDVIYHSSSLQYLDTNMLNALTAGGRGRKEGRQASYFSAAHLQESKAVPDRKSWQPLIIPYVHHKWHIDAIFETDLVNAQSMSKILSNIQLRGCSLRRHSSRGIARVVGHDGRILYDRSSQVAPHAQAIQKQFWASGDRLLDPDQKQKQLDFCMNVVDSA